LLERLKEGRSTTQPTKKDLQARKEWKFRLTRMLYEREYEREDIIKLFRFLDWILELPEGLKQEFKSDLKRYEQEKQMPYITSIERMGIEEGRKEGRKEGERSVIFRQLTRRVGLVPEVMTDRIQQLPIDRLEDLAEALLDFTQLNDLVDWLENDR
jgi:predicted transposase YdaD